MSRNAQKRPGMKSDLDQIAQVIIGATMMLVDLRRGAAHLDDQRDVERLDRLVTRLEDASQLIHGN